MTNTMNLIERRLAVPIAEKQFRKRKRLFGARASVCFGCGEILICSGPISFEVCRTLDEMTASGLLSGPKKISWRRMRRRFLPIDDECLNKYSRFLKG